MSTASWSVSTSQTPSQQSVTKGHSLNLIFSCTTWATGLMYLASMKSPRERQGQSTSHTRPPERRETQPPKSRMRACSSGSSALKSRESRRALPLTQSTERASPTLAQWTTPSPGAVICSSTTTATAPPTGWRCRSRSLIERKAARSAFATCASAGSGPSPSCAASSSPRNAAASSATSEDPAWPSNTAKNASSGRPRKHRCTQTESSILSLRPCISATPKRTRDAGLSALGSRSSSTCSAASDGHTAPS
mmetsp:Transcript_46307/g.100580  ORF Transcript_46307/g.100580 Transcript_46307/m.100580 type:complete len:250 (-) Transcript_46307:98-847(-)